MPDHLNSDELRFAIWPTEHAIFDAHSNEAIHTGRVHVFDGGECRSAGRWS